MNKRTLSICGAAMFLSMLVSSAFGYEKEIEQLSAQMAEKIAGKGKKTVAVVDFTDLEGNVTQLDQFIAEEFSVALASAGKGFRVIDRTRLKSIIKENKLAATGMIDPATASKLGKIAGVDALVTGTLTPFGDNVRLTVKVLDSETADIIDSSKEDIAKTKAIEELLIKPASLESKEGEKSNNNQEETKKETIEGEVFSDDFNAGPKPDWNPILGDWIMDNGMYTVSNIEENKSYFSVINKKQWKNFVLNTDISILGVGQSISMFIYRASVCPRVTYQDRICFGIEGGSSMITEAFWYTTNEGKYIEKISRVQLSDMNKKTIHLKIDVRDGLFVAYLDNKEINRMYNNNINSGMAGLSQEYTILMLSDLKIGFDNLEIKPLAD